MSTIGASATPRAAVAPALLLLAAFAWVAVAVVGHGMGTMPGTMGFGVVAFVAVWALMMAAMMLPSIAPFVAVYTRTFGTDGSSRVTRTASFVGGYFLVWAMAGVPAYGLARAADALVPAHPAGATTFAVLAFAACGIYQLTPLKDRCLAWCRSPLGFTLKYSAFRGRTRDLRVGMHHGAFCFACCWGLMVLLLAFGLMNLVAMVGLAFVVLAERTKSWGPTLGRAVGVAALGLAVAVIFVPALAPALHRHGNQPTTMQMGM